MSRGVRPAIERQLAKGPATVEELSDATDWSPAAVLHTLSTMYFEDGNVGCDTRRRYHLLTGDRLSNGVPVVRHLDGRDVFA